MQAAFDELNGKQDCLGIMQHILAEGDAGVIVMSMRECCGLKPLHESSLLGDLDGEEVALEVVSLNLSVVNEEVEEAPREGIAMPATHQLWCAAGPLCWSNAVCGAHTHTRTHTHTTHTPRVYRQWWGG